MPIPAFAPVDSPSVPGDAVFELELGTAVGVDEIVEVAEFIMDLDLTLNPGDDI